MENVLNTTIEMRAVIFQTVRSAFSETASEVITSWCYTFVNFVVFVHTSIPKTASIIATSIAHSKLYYCNYLYYHLFKSQLTRIQQIQYSRVHAVVKAPKSCHIAPILRSFHWLKITECIEYKLLSLTYKVLTTTKPP